MASQGVYENELLSQFERKTGIHVHVIFKNDRGIMSDLDHSTGASDSAMHTPWPHLPRGRAALQGRVS
ncbi:MAG: hypothetical protein DMG93_09575 [Acidobacteria bacterium]|nr:MAG: hypothetical protein DMG93_09575 [Acidobacteriota bacterium]